MSREIRITVDDDEVFERMKSRKRDLDLSWEEVLHRGLRQNGRGAGADERYWEGEPRGGRRYPDPVPRDPIDDPTGFAEDLKREIQGQVRDSLRASFGASPRDEPARDPLESEVTTLESAEDALLVCDFLGDAADEIANQVPLRVTLEASPEGLAVDVVAVRQGKGVDGMNAFDPNVRQRIVERLAGGGMATLRLEAGDEGYSVAPVLTWSRDAGVPTVADVTIEEVRFDVE